jgi:hypothetical protein
MVDPNIPNIKIDQKKAQLTAIENGLAEFLLNCDFSKNPEAQDENIFFWPTSKLPSGIKIGDQVCVSMELKNKEERISEIKKEKEQEFKYTKMRELLENLVN